MSEHISDELPALLTGDADRATVLAAVAHLRGCPDCQQELVSALVAHASLSSARRFAPEAVAAPVPPDRPDPGPLPDLSAVFAQVREEAAAAPPRRRRRTVGLLAAAAVVAGGATAAAVVATSSSSGPSTRTVALAAPSGGRAATATIGGSRMRVDASGLPRLDSRHEYEVWLTDSAGHLQPVGFVGSGQRADLTLPASLVARYQDIAVSKQRVGQIPFSGIVVARGTYS